MAEPLGAYTFEIFTYKENLNEIVIEPKFKFHTHKYNRLLQSYLHYLENIFNTYVNCSYLRRQKSFK
jgi:hypothetical protein